MGLPATPPTYTVRMIPAGQAGANLLAADVAAALSGGPPVALVPEYGPELVRASLLERLALARQRPHPGRSTGAATSVPGDAAVILPTSGSTGAPRLVVLSRDALRAAAAARDVALGGASAWFVALPPVTAGALIATTRALLSGHTLESWSGSGGLARFEAAAVAAELLRFVDRAETRGEAARITLVAAQLDRLCADPAAVAALARFDRVLLGGGPAAASTLRAAAAAGLTVTTTYGMTETCGGCVYDGHPTADAICEVGDDSEILLGGSCLAWGYLDSHMPTTGGGLFHTGDRGRLRGDGGLQVLGRFDEVVTVGGVNVDLAAVARVVAGAAGVVDSAVVAVPNSSGGHRVVAHVVGSASAESIRRLVTQQLGTAAAPRVLLTSELPRLAGGKVDVQRLQKGPQ